MKIPNPKYRLGGSQTLPHIHNEPNSKRPFALNGIRDIPNLLCRQDIRKERQKSMRCEKGTFSQKHAFGAHFEATTDTASMRQSPVHPFASNSIEVIIDAWGGCHSLRCGFKPEVARRTAWTLQNGPQLHIRFALVTQSISHVDP
jgi:hypothetical protein